MHDAVEPVDVLADPVRERVQVLGVGDVKLDDRRQLGQPLGDPLDQAEPPEAGQHDCRALLLRDPGDVEGDRRIGEHAGDQDPLTVQ